MLIIAKIGPEAVLALFLHNTYALDGNIQTNPSSLTELATIKQIIIPVIVGTRNETTVQFQL